jgi:hypothetical protein
MTDAMVLSTDGLPPGETAPAWHAWMSQLFAGLDTDLYGDRLFEGHVRVANAGDVVLTRLEAGRHRVMRSMQGLRAQESPYLKIVAPWEGVASVRQHNREASVRRGSWVIYDTSQEYEVANPEWSEHLIVMLPRQAIVDRGIRLEGLMGRNVGGSCMTAASGWNASTRRADTPVGYCGFAGGGSVPCSFCLISATVRCMACIRRGMTGCRSWSLAAMERRMVAGILADTDWPTGLR